MSVKRSLQVAVEVAEAKVVREFGPDSGPGHPSGANLQIAEEMGRYVNSFTWRGDPPR